MGKSKNCWLEKKTEGILFGLAKYGVFSFYRDAECVSLESLWNFLQYARNRSNTLENREIWKKALLKSYDCAQEQKNIWFLMRARDSIWVSAGPSVSLSVGPSAGPSGMHFSFFLSFFLSLFLSFYLPFSFFLFFLLSFFFSFPTYSLLLAYCCKIKYWD